MNLFVLEHLRKVYRETPLATPAEQYIAALEERVDELEASLEDSILPRMGQKPWRHDDDGRVQNDS